MGRVTSMIGILIALAASAYLYTHLTLYSARPAGESPTKQTVDLAGVKSDLLLLANAERGQLALEGKYATLDELVAKGSIPAGRTRRPPYSYRAEVDGAAAFRIIATYEGPPGTGAPQRVSIDQDMQIKAE